jgi:uncharacterized protein (TIGR03437 family)
MGPFLPRRIAIFLCVAVCATAAVRRPAVDQRATATLDDIAKRRESRVPPIAPPRSIHEPQRVLPKRQDAAGVERASSLPRATTANAPVNYSGFLGLIDNFTAIPPDTTGAVGPQHVVTMLNTQVNIQSRTGAARANFPISLDAFWSPVGASGTFDPRILYDAAADRWIASAGTAAQTTSSALLLAVSQSGDPGGAWSYFKVNLGPSVWGDFPVLGFNGNWIVISVNLFRMGTESYWGTGLYVFNKADLYRGGAGAHVTFTDTGGELIPARDLDNRSDTLYFVQSYSGQTPAFRISKLQGQPGQEAFAAGNGGIVLVDDAWADMAANEEDLAPQLGSTRHIDAGDSRLQNCVLRGGSIWCAQTVFLPAQNPTRSAIQWLQIDPATPRMAQRGRIDDPTGAWMYSYPSIAVNRNNDVLIGFSRFGAGDYASAGFAFRTASDPPNTLEPEAMFKRGEAPYSATGWSTTSNRWGDYSATLVDPADDLSFWTLQEYAATPPSGKDGRFGTWWAKVTAPSVASTCSYTLSTTTQSVGAAAGSGSVTVSTAAGCAWMAASNAPWIQVAPGSAGAGSGAVTYTVSANPNPNAARTGTLTIAGQTFTVTQGAPSAGVDLAITAMSAPSSGTPGQSVAVSATVVNRSPAAAGAFRIGFYLGPGSSVTTRDALLGSCAVPGLAAGASTMCTRTVALPDNLQGTYAVGAIADDQLQIADPAPANNTRVSDFGPIAISAASVRPVFPAQAVVNAASYQGAGVAPGEVVTIFGTNLGAATAQFPTVSAGGVVDTIAGGTRVLFDGVAAPMIYATAGQVSAVAPFALNGRTATQVQIEYLGARSDAVLTPVVAAAPAIFTMDRSGRGAGAILNQDLTANSATNPSRRGDTVVIYGTGGGALPGAVDGRLAQAPFPSLSGVTVRVGGVAAEVTYAGPAPGLVAGVLQINAIVPAGASSGAAIPIDVVIAGATSQPGVTVAIQ